MFATRRLRTDVIRSMLLPMLSCHHFVKIRFWGFWGRMLAGREACIWRNIVGLKNIQPFELLVENR